jgi:hypothetical protein
MIAAARAESRSRVAVIVPARCLGAATRLLLAAEPAPARAGLDFAVLSIEDALARLATGEPVWDAIIVLPELRGLIVTMLARQCKIAGPWPMLWHDRNRVLICGETPAGAGSGNALDATLLAQSLILAVQMAGHSPAARQLHEAWARLRDRGVTTARRGSDAPYVTQVSDADMVDLLCSDAPVVSDRAIAGWKALSPVPQDRPTPCAPRLSLVAGG